jgi:hypothetical protein
LELNVLGELDDQLLVEAVAVVDNKGSVRQSLSDFRFDLHYLPQDGKVIEGDDHINRQTCFQPVVRRRYWTPPDWGKSFVDPGVIQRFTDVTSLRRNAAFALLYARFRYPGHFGSFHTAQRAFLVRQNTAKAIGATGT